MASPSFTRAFIIFRLDENGKPTEIIPYYTNAATYVAVSISICRGMLRNSAVKDAFRNFAEKFDPKSLGAWQKGLSKEKVAEIFINKILDRFPLVFVDGSMTHPDIDACHYRRAFGDDGYGFEPRDQGILINGQKVREMCIAGTNTEGSNDPKEQERFRVFLFIFAMTFMHEIGHMFVTFLGLGKTETPPHVYAQVIGNSQGTTGEAGEYLETLILGGVTTVLRNPAEEEGQAGLCYLITKSGTYQILQETIDEFTRYQFNFPISVGDPFLPSMKTLGDGIPLKHHVGGDPMDVSETQQLLRRHEANPFKWATAIDKLIAEKNPNPTRLNKHHESIIEQVPSKPGLLLEDRPESRA